MKSKKLLSDRHTSIVCLLIFLGVALLIPSGTALASSNGVVISQIYGGGGNSGATFKNDFIEVFNSSGTPVDLTGWSVQYASAAGTTWQVTALSGTLSPGAYYLVQEAQGAGGTTNLPTPNATGNIAMSATSGKVALVSSTTALSGACPAGGAIIDFVGYGTSASCFEGTAAAPTLNNTTADLRKNNGAQDTDNNSADFATGAPNPRNSVVSLNPTGVGAANPSSVAQGGTTLLTVSVTPGTGPTSTGITVSADLSAIGGSSTQAFFDDGTNGDATAGDNVFSFSAVVAAATTPGTKTLPASILDEQGRTGTASIPLTVTEIPLQLAIHDIQGAGNISPFAGHLVTTTGIVTGVRSNGFFFQAPDNAVDADPNTSEGLFVFTSSAPPAAAAMGNMVQVTGTVAEFIPSADPNSPSQTELSGAITVVLQSTGNALPTPVTLTAADTDPAGPIDQLEKYESMRVHIDVLTSTSPTDGNVSEANATATSNGIFYGVIQGIARPFREPGVQVPDPLPAGAPANVPRWDANPELIRVDTGTLTGSTKLDVTSGATVTNLTGPLGYSNRSYTILTEPGSGASATGNVSATPVPAQATNELTIANFNMERFFDTVNDPGTSDVALTSTAFANRLNKASLAIRNVLNMPDIIGVEEMEHQSTLQAVADKVNSDAVADGKPNPNYQAYLVEGNDIGGIDVGFLVKGNVNVILVEQVGKDATYVEPNGTTALLNDRPPLVLTATVAQPGSDVPLPVTVVVNHLRSLLNVDDPVDGPRVRAKRAAQAEFVANLLQTHQAGGENVVQVCDCNAFEFNDGYVDSIGTITGSPTPADQVVTASPDLVDPDFTDLVSTATHDQQYSYVENGSAQVLDHILVNPPMLARLTRFATARNDADFPEVYRNDPNRPERISDHDMPVAYFSLPEPTPPPALAMPSTITAEATSPAGALVSYTATATDSIDGTAPVTCSPASDSVFPLGETTVSCSATNSHNKTATGSFTVIVVDTIAPALTASAVAGGQPFTSGGWTNQTVVVSFSCSDSGSGVAASTAPISVAGEGANQSVTGSCADQAGNAASITFSGINIDLTAPNAPSVSVSPLPNAAGWNRSNVLVSFASNGDSGPVQSGVSGCTAPVTVAAETAGVSVSGTCNDLAGNASAASSTSLKIDKTPPEVAVLGVSEGATYALGEVPVADCSTTDALSGVATTATAAVSGGTANGVGGFTATCSGASDVAENVTPPVSAGYTVGYVFVGFLPPMNTGPSGGVFNAGRTIPLKWRLMDASGTAITAVSAVSSLQIAPNPSCAPGGEGAPVTTLYPGNAELLLESPTYHVNWDTTGLATGCYSVMLALDDTSVMTSIVPLR